MLLLDLQQQLHPLSRGEKLKIIRFLADELTQEENDTSQKTAAFNEMMEQSVPLVRDWRTLEGAYKGKMSTVDEFIARKEEEKRLE